MPFPGGSRYRDDMEHLLVLRVARNLREMEGRLRRLEESKAGLKTALRETDKAAHAVRAQIAELKRLLAEVSDLTALN